MNSLLNSDQELPFELTSPSNLIAQAQENLAIKVDKELEKVCGHLSEQEIKKRLVRIVRGHYGMKEEYYLDGKFIIAADYRVNCE